MKDFIRNHKKQIKIGGIVFCAIFLLLIIWLFILPSFSTNKYGDRLKELSNHKVTDSDLNKVKTKTEENGSVSSVKTHIEGRIINFVVKVDNNLSADDAKKVADSMIGELNDDAKKYYDVQILIDTDQENGSYPIVGYKSKKSDTLSYGNVGGNGE